MDHRPRDRLSQTHALLQRSPYYALFILGIPARHFVIATPLKNGCQRNNYEQKQSIARFLGQQDSENSHAAFLLDKA